MHWLAVYCWTSYADSFAEQNHWNTFSGIIWQHNSIPSFVCLVTRVMKMFDHFVSGQRCLIPWYFKSVVNQPEREITGATWMVLLQCNNGTHNRLFKTDIKIRFMNIPSSFKLNIYVYFMRQILQRKCCPIVGQSFVAIESYTVRVLLWAFLYIISML